MAEKRMFSKKVIDTDYFLEMPTSAQNLYFHLGMRADDDGFVDNYKSIMRIIGAKEDDLKILILKKFILPFDNGVIVITHWRINNYLRNDRYSETKYQEEKSMLEVNDKGEYELKNDFGIPGGIPGGIPSIISNSNNNKTYDYSKHNLLGEKEINNKEKDTSFLDKKKKYGKYGRILLSEDEYQRLVNDYGEDYISEVIDRIDEYVESNGNKNKYKNFNLVIRKAIRDKWTCLNGIEKEKKENEIENLF